MQDAVHHWLQGFGGAAPWVALALFLGASLLMIWRLESLSAAGLEGTVLGTLVMPYCSGLGNLLFAFVLGRAGGDSREVMVNCLVNNVTNLTLLIGLPALGWGLALAPGKGKGRSKGKAGGDGPRVQRLSLLFTMVAAAFFTGATWALGRDGVLGRSDGMVLVGLFLFWQAFHVFEVLKEKGGNGGPGWFLLVDVALLAIGAYGVYVSIDWLVSWVRGLQSGFVSAAHLGWLSGWLMVVPNALLALYYAARRRPEVVYSSQIGDGHICVPLCIGIYAIFRPLAMPPVFELGMWLLLGALGVHFLFIGLLGRLPRWVGATLVAAYGFFLWKGLLQ